MQSESTSSQLRFKYGEKRTWELALDAVENLSAIASRSQVLAWIKSRYPAYNEKNIVDLEALSVNSPSRTSYAANRYPRLTNTGHSHDRLFKVGRGVAARFELYDPEVHGVWEILPAPLAGNRYGMGIRRRNEELGGQLGVVPANDFNPESIQDARKRVRAEIYQRRGQSTFRSALCRAYNNACVITGCKVLDILEAAHIYPYKGQSTNVVTNGLLLRADIHTLFDLRLIAIDPETMTVLVSPELLASEYAMLAGKTILSPENESERASVDALNWHRSTCGF